MDCPVSKFRVFNSIKVQSTYIHVHFGIRIVSDWQDGHIRLRSKMSLDKLK